MRCLNASLEPFPTGEKRRKGGERGREREREREENLNNHVEV